MSSCPSETVGLFDLTVAYTEPKVINYSNIRYKGMILCPARTKANIAHKPFHGTTEDKAIYYEKQLISAVEIK